MNRSFRLAAVFGLSLVFILTIPGFFLLKVSQADSQTATQTDRAGGRIALRAAGRGNPWINLRDGHDLPTVYTGAANLAQSLSQNLARPLALASDDLDEDGVPDLISGYTSPDGGILTLHRGNVDSIFPNSPEAQQRKAAGAFTESPFLAQARVFATPEAPDFLGTGDFDGDGHWDVVAAARGSSALYLLPGDGRGALGQAQRIDLPGNVTALAAGEINRQDGLADIVVGVVTAEGPKTLVFESPEGALKGQPEAIGLPAKASALALGQLDEDYPMDLAVAAGTELMIVHGRDRKLSLDAPSQPSVPTASISRFSFSFVITSIAIGDFTGDHRTEVALLSTDGMVRLVNDRSTPSTREKVIAGDSEALVAGAWPQATKLIRAQVSSLTHNDLVVVDSANHQLHVLTASPTDDLKTSTASSARRVAVSLDVEGEPVAVLPMRLNVDALSDLVILKSSELSLTLALTAPMATYTVNELGFENDFTPGNGICDTQPGILGDQCSFTAAIQEANAHSGADEIIFASLVGGTGSIPGPLVGVFEPVTINGSSAQPGGRVELNGALGGGVGFAALNIFGGNSVIRGLVINRFGSKAGIRLEGGGNNIIESNFIGTNVNGDTALGNDTGIFINADSNNNTIGGVPNVISGNLFGIWISGGIGGGGGTGNLVQGNFIGTNGASATALGNQNDGVLIVGAANNTIGGTQVGAHNVISGNGQHGVMIIGNGAAGNLVQSNFIGTDVSGAIALGNSGNAVNEPAVIDVGPNTIGGTIPAARNVISGNFYRGVVSIGSLVQGNFIGVDVNGMALGNAAHGVVAQGNSTIGGITGGAGNVIAFNGGDGSYVTGVGVTILRNSIFSNAGLGIDLDPDGVTANDNCDPDLGANNRQNFPSLTSATSTGSSVLIQGALNSAANTTFRIEFFANTTCDPSGNGEGQTFIGSTNVTTDASCNAAISATLPVTLTAGQFITATATRLDGSGNPVETSEFSACIPFATNNPPTITAAAPLTRQQGSTGTVSTIANVSDTETAAGSLVVTATAVPAGLTVTSITNTNGTITANVAASCTATLSANTVVLTVTDGNSGAATANLTVNVTANTAPTLTYSNQSVAAGGSLTVNPATGPSDNGTINSIVVQSQGTYTDGISVNSGTGVVSLSGANPVGTHTITIRATDNCGAITNASFSLTVGSCITVSIPNNLTGTQGSGIAVPITVSDLTGRGVVSYDFTLMFDTAVLSLQTPPIDATGTLSSGMTVTPNTTLPGKITVSAFGIAPLSGSGTLLNLRFNVVGSVGACTDLTWISFRFNEKDPCVATSNGRFCVIPNTFSISGVVSYCIATAKKVAGAVLATNNTPPISSTTNSAGSYILNNVPRGSVTVTPTKTGDVNGITSFDASQVAQAAAGLITLTSCQQVAADASNNGMVTSFDASLIAQFAAGLPVTPPSIVGTWKFIPSNRTYNLSSNLTNENYDAVLVGDVTGNWMPQPGLVTPVVQVPISLPNTSGVSGGSVTIPITVGDLTSAGIVSYDFDLVFNQSVLQPQNPPVDATGTLSSAMTITPNVTPGRLRISAFGVNALAGSGTLLNLKFNVVGAAGTSTALTWQSFIFNEDAQTNLTNGSFIVTQSAGLMYYPLPRPIRLFDTRAPIPGFAACEYLNQPLVAGGELARQARIICDGITIPASAQAIVGNATIINPSGGGFATLWPDGQPRPPVSNLNYVAGQVVPNAFTVALSGAGNFRIYSTAATHFVVDITGYYALPGAGGLFYHPLPRPIRLFDTRAPIPGFAACEYLNQPLTADGELAKQARVTCDGITIPSDALAIVGNATVVGPAGGGFITLWPNGQMRPPVSNLNYVAGQVVPNAFTVGLGSDGQFRSYSFAGTHFIVDVTGYYSASPTDVNGGGLLYSPLAKPIRLFDTRAPIPGFAACEYLNQPLIADGELAKQARVTCDGATIAASAQAIVGNATVVGPSGAGFITLWPNGQARPPVSNLNYVAGQVVPNAFTVGLGNDGQFRIYSFAGTHFITDVTGYFAP